LEIFKDIPGYEGLYQVSNRGRVSSFVRGGKMLRPHLHPYGYMTICLADLKGGRKYRKIHRLVMAAFRGPSLLHVNHIDHVRNNNNLYNFEYVKNYEKVQHCVRAGRNSPPPKQKHKIPDEIIRIIRSHTGTGSDMVKKFNISQSHISRIRNRQAYNHVAD